MPTHKAYQLHSYGSPDSIRLDDIPVPDPGPSQVLVSVSAAAVNPFDWKVRDGWAKNAMPLELPRVLGVDFSGTVVALGDEATRFKVGDRVMAMSNKMGAFAEHIAVDEILLAHVDDALSDYEAAALPSAAMTAWTSLHAARDLSQDAKLLIHGASGSVGSLAVQFAKAAGAYVIGIASAKNRDYVMDLGADEFIDYQTQSFEDCVTNIDLVLDYVLAGGDTSHIERSWSVLAPGGTLVTINDPTIANHVPEGRRGLFSRIVPSAELLGSIAEMVISGQIRTKVSRVFARNELTEALEISRTGAETGRLIVDFKRP